VPVVPLEGVCIQPPDEDVPVWRFLTLAKFIDFVTTRALFFSNLSLAEDPYDGRPVGGIQSYLMEITGGAAHLVEQIRDVARNGTFVSCWHCSEHEPAAMWKLYASDDSGLALRTTYRRLKAALDAYPHDVHMGVINYRSDDRHFRMHTLTPVMIKRPSFEHEREVRAIIRGAKIDPHAAGLHVPVPFEVLEPEVVMGPATQPWISDAVRRLLSQLGRTLPIRVSDLYTLAPVPKRKTSTDERKP
jgi:hypothetical protein